MEKISDSMKKILLAGIGAAATTAEKSKEILGKGTLAPASAFMRAMVSVRLYVFMRQ